MFCKFFSIKFLILANLSVSRVKAKLVIMSNTESFEWLNADYIKSFLSKITNESDLKVINFKISSGSAQGENFAGVIFRVNVNYAINGNEKSASYILKASPVAGAVAELLESFNVFDGELYLYQKILEASGTLLPGFKMAPR